MFHLLSYDNNLIATTQQISVKDEEIEQTLVNRCIFITESI